MGFEREYARTEPRREEIDTIDGPVLLEFGVDWCPHCQAVQRPLADLLEAFPQVRHIKVEDGKGRPLGRSFRVKLWPNLVFLRGGQVVAQLARPEPEEIRTALQELTQRNETPDL
jgi:thioredoxin 1